MVYVDIYICEWRDCILNFAFLVSLAKLGVLATLGSLSLMVAVSQNRRATALSSLFFDLVCSLGHEVSTVPYSSLCIICLALLGMWFS